MTATVARAARAGISEADWAAAVRAVRELPPGGRVQLVCHVNPDGDALGSMLGCALGLAGLGAELRASFPGAFEIPGPFTAMPGLELLVPEAEAFDEPDLLLVFDVAAESRMGGLARLLGTARASVVFDHHASNTGFGGVLLLDPVAAATSVVVEEFLRRLGVAPDARIAECLYIALATDTGSFRFDATTPEVHELAARLIATGLRPGEISRRIFDSRPFGAMKLFGDVLARAELDPAAAGGHGLVWTYATLDDLERHGQRPYVLEALIGPVRCVAEADAAVVLKQVAGDEWSVSLRSNGAVDVSAVAAALGGGGHRLAAGCTLHGTPAELVARIRAQLELHLTD